MKKAHNKKHTESPAATKVFVGVDPAFRKNGMAACIIDLSDKSVSFRRFKTFADFCLWVIGPESPECGFWCVENSNMQKATFDSTGGLKVAMAKSRNVGMNQAISQCVADLCAAKYGAPNVLSISPRQKGAKLTDNEMFIRMLKWEALGISGTFKGSQDERDAYKIATIGMQQYRIAIKTIVWT